MESQKLQTFNIRPVQTADAPEWLRMRKALWPHCSEVKHLEEMQEILDDTSKFACFVVERSGSNLGGFLEASIHQDAPGCETQTVGYLEGWYVDQELRRHGLGRELVVAAERWAEQLGCQEMASDCLIDNLISLSAHLALGYAEAERLIHFCKRL